MEKIIITCNIKTEKSTHYLSFFLFDILPTHAAYIPYKVRVILCIKFELCSIYLVYGWLYQNKQKHTKTNCRNVSFQMGSVPAMPLNKKAVRFLISFWVHCAKHVTRCAVPKKSPPDFKSARHQTADAIPG